MTQHTTHVGRTARRLATLAVPLLVATTGTAAAHSGGSYGGGMMGSGLMGAGGLFGGTMGFWGLLWMGLLLAVPVLLVYVLLTRDSGAEKSQPLSTLRERYARGELSDDEFERRREQLERTG